MTGKKRILLIDDEKDLLEEMTLRLEAVGYEVLVAFDGQEGLEKAREDKPDLIQMDVLMPKMNGYQVCRELKGADETKSIPIILLTARAQESDKFLGKETGANAYITKPYEIDLLLKKMRALLGEKE